MPTPLTRRVPCTDSLGRPGVTGVTLAKDGRRATVMPPAPAGAYDAAQLDQLIDALQVVRALMSGGR